MLHHIRATIPPFISLRRSLEVCEWGLCPILVPPNGAVLTGCLPQLVALSEWYEGGTRRDGLAKGEGG